MPPARMRARRGLAWVAGVVVAVASPLLAPVPAQTPAVTARDLVRAYTLAFDRQEDQRWRDSVVRHGLRDPGLLALLDATAWRLTYRYAAADSAYTRAAALAGPTALPYVRLGQAALRSSRGDLAGAQRAVSDAVTMLAQQRDSSGEADARGSLALFALRTSGVSAARTQLSAARAVAPRHDPLVTARLACATLQVDVRSGTRVADTTWRRLQAESRALGPRFLAECGFVYAQYLSTQGSAPAAVAMFDSVAVAQSQIRAWHALSSTRQWQGSELMGRGYHRLARERLEEAVRLAEQSQNTNALAWALNELGRLAQRTGASADAADYARRARPLFVASGDRVGQVYADNAIAQAALLNGDVVGADSLLVRLSGELAVVSPVALPAALTARAWIAGRTDVPRSLQLLDSVAHIAQSRSLPGWVSELLYHRALASLRGGRPREAIPRLDSLVARRIQGPMLFETLERRAEAYAALGVLDSAWLSYNDATRSLERWRSATTRRELVLASLQDRAYDFDRDLDVATLVARVVAGGRVPAALAMAEARRVRAREQEALQRGGLALETGGGLESARTDAAVAARVVVRAPAPTSLDAARLPALAASRLSPNDAVLSYITGVGGEPTTLFVLTRSQVTALTLPPIDSLLPQIRTFTGLLAAGRYSAPLAGALAAAVLAPALAPLPPEITRLTIVPDGELHRLPFVALDLPGGTPLLDRYTVAHALSVDDALGGVRRAPRTRNTGSLAVGAPDRMPRVETMEWPALPGARREVRAVADAIDDMHVLRGRDATREAVLAATARGGRVLHVATHALADPASFARTAMALQATDRHDGLLRLADLQRAPLAFDLVVLSACASSEGVLLAGQGVHGFVGAMLDAGAGGVIATRWAVGDSAVVPWMHTLYRELLVDGDPAGALQRTLRAARAAGVSPAVWANLQFVGDPTVRVPLARRAPSAWGRMVTAVRRWFGGD